jgi:protein TonB
MLDMDAFAGKAGALSRGVLLVTLVCLGSTLTAAPVGAQPLRWAPTPTTPVPAASPSMTPPRYKAEWALAGKVGTVVLLLSVNADGSVADVAVETSSGHQELDDASVEAARTWRFRAPVANGVAVPSKVRVPLDFNPALAAPPPQTE